MHSKLPVELSSKLKCVMYCDFHARLGPQIKYQYPEDFINKEEMDSIAPYIITKPTFQGNLISLKAFGYTFMGYPIVITNKKYERNALFFNVVFVFDEADCVQEFEPVVTKLAGYMRILELESAYISDKESEKNIPEILKNIWSDLSSTGECTIPINTCNTIYLKINSLPTEPPTVLDHHVPIFNWSKGAVDSQHWNLTAKRVLPYIDGFNHVQKIATLANVDLALVRSAIETMVFHGVLELTPIFLYSNMYAVKPEVNNLYHDEEMRKECITFVARDANSPPLFRDVFTLFCALGPGISVTALCGRYDLLKLGIDEKKMILFGIVKKFIHKLCKYPVLTSSDCLSLKIREKSRWMKGYYNYDEICCLSSVSGTPMTHDELNAITEDEQHVVHVWK